MVKGFRMKKELNYEELERLTEIYKLFGSIPRIKILLHLNNGECSASDLSQACGLSQSATSHQLKDLKQGRIIKSRKEGMNVFYSLDDNHIVQMLENGIEHITGSHHE